MTATEPRAGLEAFAWGERRLVRTKNGDRWLRKSRVTEEAIAAWEAGEAALRKLGVSFGPVWKKPGEFEFCHWAPVEPEPAQPEREEASRSVSADIEVPLPDGLSLMPYQRAGVAFIMERGRVLLADEQGLGKTVQVIAAINCDATIRRVLVVCPAHLKTNWHREATKWLARPLRVGVQDAGIAWIGGLVDVVIVNFESAVKHAASLRAEPWDMLVVDECFTAGTLVKTPSGPVPIEDIRAGDVVCNAAGTGIVKRTGSRQADGLVCVVTERGSVTCTPEHPFLTQKGWVKACNLNATHYIKTHEQTVRIMRQGIHDHPGEEVLRNIVLGEMEDGPAANQSEALHSGSREEDRRRQPRAPQAQPVKGAGHIHSDEGSKSNALSNRERASIGLSESHGAQATRSRWERDWSEPSRACAACVAAGSPVEPRSTARHKISWLPDTLQARPGLAGITAGLGGGRQEPRLNVEEGAGPKEGGKAEGIRVVRVESYKSESDFGDCVRSEGVEVFNLEVAGHPSYVVTSAEMVAHNCHALKNPKALRTIAVLGDRKHPGVEARRLVLASGTPMLNDPSELWTLLNACHPDAWGSWWQHRARYCRMRETKWGLKVVGSINEAELNQRLRSGCMIRRTKDQVLADLPPKRRQIMELPSDGFEDIIREEMEAVKRWKGLDASRPEDWDTVMDETGAGDFELQEDVARAQLRTARAKLPMAFEHLAELQAAKVPVIVFAHHREICEAIHKEFPESALIYGGMSEAEKDEAVTAFQGGKVNMLVGGLKAASTGLNLQRAQQIVMLEIDWNPATMEQAEDRAHRIGQTGSLLVQYLVLEGSVDLLKLRALNRKGASSRKVVA